MALRVQAASYRYPTASSPAIGPLDLLVEDGEIVLLTGPTGCGKSTLLRLVAGLLQRHGHGEARGRVLIDGQDPATLSPRERVAALGFVSQEPIDQVVGGTLGDEIAFALESAGWDAPRIDARVDELLRRCGLPLDPDRPALALSGGQLQRLVLASALAGGARLLLLDEPISQIDPSSAQALLKTIRGLADDGVSVLLVEHRIEACLPFCDRILVLDDGALCSDRPATEPDLPLLRRLGLSVPGMMDLRDRLGHRLDRWEPEPAACDSAPSPSGPELLGGDALSYRWPRASAPALSDLRLSLGRGERVVLLGGNGAGKSTLLKLLSGELRGGDVRRGGRLIDVPQDPDLALFCETVLAELRYGGQEAGWSAETITEQAEQAAAALSIVPLLPRAPHALSRGQRLRTAVAAALACQPDILLLDEPSSGQDEGQIERLMSALSAAFAGGLLVFATHDIDLALRYGSRALLLHEGRLLRDGPPLDVLRDLPAEVPLRLPPLARWCLERGLPYARAAELAPVPGEGG